MHTATILVKYLDEPKSPKGPWSLKDENGARYKAWGETAAKLRQGQTYTVAYTTEHDEKYGDQHIIKKIVDGGSDPQMPPTGRQQPTGGVSALGASGDAKSEDMACMSCCGRYLGGLGQGGIEFPDASQLERMFRNTRLAWRKSLKEPEKPKIDYAGELNDEIPGF